MNKPYEIFAKRQGLENALTNILLNAVEHAECSTIELNATHERGHVLITVTDDGKGVDPAIDAFRPYVSENKPDTGGLGLYLCKQIVESMNGTLSYESCAGKTVFTIKLLKA